MVVFTVAWVNIKVFQRGGRKQHKAVFVLSRSLLLNRLEPQSNKAKVLLPIVPIGIVAYSFTLFVGQPLSKQLYDSPIFHELLVNVSRTVGILRDLICTKEFSRTMPFAQDEDLESNGDSSAIANNPQ